MQPSQQSSPPRQWVVLIALLLVHWTPLLGLSSHRDPGTVFSAAHVVVWLLMLAGLAHWAVVDDRAARVDVRPTEDRRGLHRP